MSKFNYLLLYYASIMEIDCGSKESVEMKVCSSDRIYEVSKNHFLETIKHFLPDNVFPNYICDLL